MVDISVIVPVYNVENYLDNCITGILAQSYSNFELILVNDGSLDNSSSICKGYEKQDDRIKLIHQDNQGSGAARNRGLDIAKGKYIYFCDADDYMEPTLLEENYLLAEKYEANMVIFGYCDKIIRKNEFDFIPRTNKKELLNSKEDFRKKFGQLFNNGVMYTVWNKLYKKDYLNMHNYRFGNERVGQDTIFNYNIYKNIDKVYINDGIYYHYLVGRANSAVNKYRQDRFRLRYEESLKLEQLINSWKYEKIYKSLLINEWLLTLTVGIHNLFFDECPLNNGEKKREIHRYINHAKIKEALHHISYKKESSSFGTKLKYFLLKNKQVSLYYYLLKYKKGFS
ncbi:glycosyltransferase family 2 protein [Ureibacillus sinduriensis]|uniref:glycosyltransferase family 2 protein n=1 Tax=Ureibacillus sinduriensis TaxID=561440 RepID=UPI0006923BE4|nr:glycosyltransferase [Ureibacillus sinduriensis]